MQNRPLANPPPFALRSPEEAVALRSREEALGSLSSTSVAMALSLERPASWYGAQARHPAAGMRPRRYFLRPCRELRAAPGAEDIACAICLEALAVGDTVQPMLRCEHILHEGCARALVKSQQPLTRVFAFERLSCPTCRGEMLASSLSQVPEQEREAAVRLQEERAAPQSLQS